MDLFAHAHSVSYKVFEKIEFLHFARYDKKSQELTLPALFFCIFDRVRDLGVGPSPALFKCFWRQMELFDRLDHRKTVHVALDDHGLLIGPQVERFYVIHGPVVAHDGDLRPDGLVSAVQTAVTAFSGGGVSP